MKARTKQSIAFLIILVWCGYLGMEAGWIIGATFFALFLVILLVSASVIRNKENVEYSITKLSEHLLKIKTLEESFLKMQGQLSNIAELQNKQVNLSAHHGNLIKNLTVVIQANNQARSGEQIH